MNQLYLPLRKNISMLGKLLGDTIKEALSEDVLNRVERIRKLSKKAHNHDDKHAHEQLLNEINKMTDDELLPIARAFNQFLNLTNTADQYHGISPHGEAMNNPNIIKTTIEKISSQHKDKDAILKAVQRLSIELVLTAHPTEVNRRTVINNSVAMTNCLAQLDHDDLAEYERNTIMRRLRQLTAQVWYTDEMRRRRPTPIDEARWGFTVIEDSLWEGVPSFLRELNDQLEQTLGYELPIETTPIQFTSWMGGDRDGNPNVTAKITDHVISLARLKAVELFLKDIQILINELSMTTCSTEFNDLLKNKDVQEPYREVLKQLRAQLSKTKRYLILKIEGQDVLPEPDLIVNNQQLWQPLYACYQSLKACGMKLIANGPLLDTLRRVKCFGIQLMRLDIRQDSSRHIQALSELTEFLDLGDYALWDEKQKQHFLIGELTSKRPLIPYNWQPTAETQEVLDTCRVIANSHDDSIASYVISMSKMPSDVLAVNLLLKSVGCKRMIPIVPLFETLDDLNHANSVMQALLEIDWYRHHIQGKQIVMIGYSDSAKDAGTFAASWAQYVAQEALVKTFEKADIELTLFHGRGGTIGRGGAPAHAALLSQPPGSLQGGLRVTEQGEMIRFKLGLPQLAVSSLTIYTAAILEANLLAPPEPKQQWRELMDMMSDISCTAYCKVVKENPDFVNYFRSATPEQEVSRLPLGSRPAKRRVDGGVESLRAIPWIFAWTQNRLALPAWLGAGEALQFAIDQGYEQQLREMQKSWPFFNTRLAMLEMVFKKADSTISAYYEERLVEEQYHYLGQALRKQLAKDINVILFMAHKNQPQNNESLMADLPWVAESVNLRNAYTAPLNYLQVELLARSRNNNLNPIIEQALMTTISGIAAGMRNSG